MEQKNFDGNRTRFFFRLVDELALFAVVVAADAVFVRDVADVVVVRDVVAVVVVHDVVVAVGYC
jgi:hypothetical protein